MFLNTNETWAVFERAVAAYHLLVPDTAGPEVSWDVRAPAADSKSEWDQLLWSKAWIDSVQWHAEDRIRDPHVEPRAALQLKRRIDILNQQRTDAVEFLDDYLENTLRALPAPVATPTVVWLPTETPAWALDRLSVLALKVYHMSAEANRPNADEDHRRRCQEKLDVLLRQKGELVESIDALWHALCAQKAPYRRYRQMKMYNDPTTNPVLYRKLD